MNRTAFALLLTSTVLLATCANEPAPSPEVELTPEETVLVNVGDTAPDFELVTLDGENFSLQDHRGNVVLVHFCAAWCPPCREELPYRETEIWQRFDRDRFAVIVVGREENDEVIGPFVEKHGYTVPFAGDPDKTAYDQYASRFIPRNFVIGPDGVVLFQSQGYEREEFDEMIAVIEEAVAALETIPESAENEAA